MDFEDPPLPYDPSDWYWFVAGDQTRVYSSAVVAYVPLTNPNYVSFLDRGGRTTKIKSEAELWPVLLDRGLAVPAADAGAQAAVKDNDYVTLPRAALIMFRRHENMIRELVRTVRVVQALNTAADANGLPSTANSQDLTVAQFMAAVKQLL